MQFLEAILAFTVTMMILSTIVSAIVEAIHAMFNQRAKGLELLIRHIYDEAILSRISPGAPNHFSKEEFVQVMTGKRWLPVNQDSHPLNRLYFRLMKKLRRIDKVDKLTTLEFFERLAETPVASAIVEKTQSTENHKLGVFLEDLAGKFEDYGECASEYFAKRSRLISVAVGFILVYCINFGVLEVFGTLLQNEQSRAVLVEQGQKLSQEWQAKIHSEIQTRGVEDPEALVKEAESAFQQGVQSLQKAQLQIGWQYAPWRVAQKSFWQWAQEDFINCLQWFFSVFFAGVLVGLGGPFWFDTYRKLSAIGALTRVFQSQVKSQASAPQTAQQTTDTSRASLFANVFNTSHQASQLTSGHGRVALSLDGEIIKQGGIR